MPSVLHLTGRATFVDWRWQRKLRAWASCGLPGARRGRVDAPSGEAPDARGEGARTSPPSGRPLAVRPTRSRPCAGVAWHQSVKDWRRSRRTEFSKRPASTGRRAFNARRSSWCRARRCPERLRGRLRGRVARLRLDGQRVDRAVGADDDRPEFPARSSQLDRPAGTHAAIRGRPPRCSRRQSRSRSPGYLRARSRNGSGDKPQLIPA
jgi:hypothetical protein